MTQVKFEVCVYSGEEQQVLSEEMLARRDEQHRADLKRQQVLSGALVIAVPGQPVLYIKDELWAAVQNFCFEGVLALLEEKPECFLYRFTSYDGHVVIIPMASMLRFIGEDIPVVTDYARNLLPALFECGLRFLELLDQLGGAAAETSQFLRPFADKARAALGQHHW